MTLTAGVLSKISSGSTSDSLSATAATSGTTPYSYQWYRSTTTAFSPGAGNAVASATALTLNDSSLIPGTQYYYKMVVIDSAATPASASYAQLPILMSNAPQNQNQFAQSSLLGMADGLVNYNTQSVMIDPSSTDTFSPGSAVKIYNSSSKIPTVVACSANSDNVLGFINFNIKDKTYVAGQMCEISKSGNVIYLYATGTIARGAQVTLDLSSPGSVQSKNSGDNIVGYAIDQGTYGNLLRVQLSTPSFTTA